MTASEDMKEQHWLSDLGLLTLHQWTDTSTGEEDNFTTGEFCEIALSGISRQNFLLELFSFHTRPHFTKFSCHMHYSLIAQKPYKGALFPPASAVEGIKSVQSVCVCVRLGENTDKEGMSRDGASTLRRFHSRQVPTRTNTWHSWINGLSLDSWPRLTKDVRYYSP